MPESHIKSGFREIPERCKEPVSDNSKLEKNIYLSEFEGIYQNCSKVPESHIKRGFREIPERSKESVSDNSKLEKTSIFRNLKAYIKTAQNG